MVLFPRSTSGENNIATSLKLYRNFIVTYNVSIVGRPSGCPLFYAWMSCQMSCIAGTPSI